ncbi:hypothetical protein D3C78_1358740 [compost metagenome]
MRELHERMNEAAVAQPHARQAAELRHRQRDRHARHIADQHGPRQQIGQHAQPQHAGDQATHAHGQRNAGGGHQPVFGGRQRHARQGSGDQRAGGGVRPHDQGARRTEQRITQHARNGGPQAGDGGHAHHRGIGQAHRQGHRRHAQPSHDIAPRRVSGDATEIVQAREET